MFFAMQGKVLMCSNWA
jgi:hypothetical protein